MLEPGAVVTVEPGIYFIDSLLETARKDERGGHIDWSVVERLRPYGGIRIEDNVVTTEGAPENLTRDAFAVPGPAESGYRREAADWAAGEACAAFEACGAENAGVALHDCLRGFADGDWRRAASRGPSR